MRGAMSGSLMIRDGNVGNPVASGVAKHVTIPVTGMTCAACQSFLQRELANQAGVKDATVNLMLHNATVTFDPGATSISALVEAIRGTGYGAEFPSEHESVLDRKSTRL